MLNRGARDTAALRSFVQAVSRWPFERMQSLHFDGLTACRAGDWTSAFRRFLDEPSLPFGAWGPKPRDVDTGLAEAKFKKFCCGSAVFVGVKTPMSHRSHCGHAQDLEFLHGFGRQLQSSGIIDPLQSKRQSIL